MQRHIITPINPRDATQTDQVSCEPVTASKAGNPIEDTPMITVFREAQSQPADIVEAELHTYLKELADFYHDWHMYQGDACYVYDNGQSC